jgi:hypothetical protein
MFLLSGLAALLIFGGTGARAATTLTDPAGDALGGAADITQVDVSSDLEGNITFVLAIANRTTLTSDDRLFIVLDSDKDPSTGTVNGFDYVIVVTAAGPTLVRASGPSSFAPAPQPTLRVAAEGKTITINRSDLGDTTGFRMVAETRLTSTSAAGDDAPDSGLFDYKLELKPVLDTLEARFAPAKPKHGKPFRLAGTTLRVEDGTIVRADSIACVAKLNGKRLGRGCSWRIPTNAKAKQLVVTLTARYRGVSATFTPWRFRVG